MSSSIFTSDINLLLKLFTGNNCSVEIWDPNEKLIINEDLNGFKDLTNKKTAIIYFPSVNQDYSGRNLSSYDLVMDFSKTLKLDAEFNQCLNYIHNREGKIRWLYTDKNKSASFLKFYNSSTWRARAISWCIKTAFKLNLQSFIQSGSFQIYSKEELKLKRLIQQVPHTDYSVFLGSEGENRTVLTETHIQNGSTHFIKIPITPLSQSFVHREKDYLKRLTKHSFRTFKIPQLIHNSFEDVMVTKGLPFTDSSRTNVFTEQHVKMLAEISEKTTQFNRLKDSLYWKSMLDQFSQLKRNPEWNKEVELINQLMSDLKNIDGFFSCLSHGDFTPWNMYCTKTDLGVYDWEMAKDQMPQLFDLFHFYFQTGVLVKRQPFSQIKRTILNECERLEVLKKITQIDLDILTYFRMYILKAALQYFNEFQGVDQLNIQNQWLAETLLEGLKDSCAYIQENHRKIFISDLNDHLQKQPHAYLKLLNPNAIELPQGSDLDILIDPKSLKGVLNFCQNHSRVEKVSVVSKSFMTVLEIYFKDQGFLAIDLITQFKRKSLQFMDPRAVLNSAKKNAFGFKIPDAAFDLEYAFLFYQLNYSSVPEKYKKHYLKESPVEIHALTEPLKLKFNLDDYTNESVLNYTKEKRQRLVWKLKSSTLNQGFNYVQNIFFYLLDTVSGIVRNPGLVITFSGVDGAGKTTVIEQVKARLEEKYRKEVILLRHRPGILPILSAIKHGKKKAEQLASDNLPRQGTNSNSISSLFRFSYYLIDYLFGQFYVYFRYTIRGKIVLYDRYYFDFINDAKRSNITLNRGFIKRLYRLIFTPDLNFFLYAKPEIILSRKKEMNAEEIDRISALYQQLFTELNRTSHQEKYQSIENNRLENTLASVYQSYQRVA